MSNYLHSGRSCVAGISGDNIRGCPNFVAAVRRQKHRAAGLETGDLSYDFHLFSGFDGIENPALEHYHS